MFKEARTSMILSDGTNPNFDSLDRRGSFLEFMLNKDGDVHMRLRRLVGKAFTRRALENMQREIDQAVEEALTKGIKAGGMDMIEDLALYVPSQMICRIIGIPEADRLQFTVRTAARTNAFFAAFLPEEVKQQVREAGERMADYFEVLVKERRKNLADDLLSELIRAEEGGDRLSGEELIVQAIGLFVAGFETTIGLIGNGTHNLVYHPEQRAPLAADEGLVDSAIEACLRFDPRFYLTGVSSPKITNWGIKPYLRIPSFG